MKFLKTKNRLSNQSVRNTSCIAPSWHSTNYFHHNYLFQCQSTYRACDVAVRLLILVGNCCSWISQVFRIKICISAVIRIRFINAEYLHTRWEIKWGPVQYLTNHLLSSFCFNLKWYPKLNWPRWLYLRHPSWRLQCVAGHYYYITIVQSLFLSLFFFHPVFVLEVTHSLSTMIRCWD